MKTLYVLDAGFRTDKVFQQYFDKTTVLYNRNVSFTKDDALLFEGGTDIAPELYGDSRHPTTQPSDEFRDAFEVEMFHKAQKAGAACIGICRGAQLLCALSGGSLIQHVTEHGRDHSIIDYRQRIYQVTSSHHQMMNPTGADHIILAKTMQNRSQGYYIGNGKSINMDIEPEIVWFPKTRSLAIQSHPEWMDQHSSAVRNIKEYFIDFIRNGANN